MKISRLVLAGATSGVGKTSISCAIIHSLKKLGYSVQPFKVGPDYIDPSYLSAISGNETINLDVWLMGRQKIIESFVSNSNSDFSLIEGVMGYYDGFSGKSSHSSTYHVASIIQSPVVLVVDASKTSTSIAAIVTGFQKFHKNSRISGVILNKIGSKKHEILCRDALEKTKLPILGVIYRNNEFGLESRHLGLIPTMEDKALKSKINKIARQISEYIDINALIKIATNTPPLLHQKRKQIPKPKIKIAVALDNSFNFYYRDNLYALQREGAEIKFFSPINNSKVPPCNGIYIGGGFPEIMANDLAKNHSMKNHLKKSIEDNVPTYAECGGLMYLTKSITIHEKKYPMVGIFDAETKMTKKMKLNYTKGTVVSNCIISKNNHSLQGHEFHYSEIDSVSSDAKYAYSLDIGEGIKDHKDGFLEYNTLASYEHLYFDRANFAKEFVRNCILQSRR